MATAETWRRASQDRQTRGLDFRPLVEDDLSMRDWGRIFDAHEGRISPSVLPAKCRTMHGRTLARLFQEANHHDGCIVPPVMDEDNVRTFLSQVERTRDGVSGGYVSAAAFSNRLNLSVSGRIPRSRRLAGRHCRSQRTEQLPARAVVQALDQHMLKPLARGGTAEHTELTVTGLGIGN